MELSHLWHWLHELRRRHVRRVFRAVVAYGIVAFALVEVTEPVTHALHLPEWVLTLVVVLLALGFPVVAVVSWILPGVADAQAPEADATSGVTPAKEEGASTAAAALPEWALGQHRPRGGYQ